MLSFIIVNNYANVITFSITSSILSIIYQLLRLLDYAIMRLSVITVNYYAFHHASMMLSSIRIILSIIYRLWCLIDHASMMLSIIRIILSIVNINCYGCYIEIMKLGIIILHLFMLAMIPSSVEIILSIIYQILHLCSTIMMLRIISAMHCASWNVMPIRSCYHEASRHQRQSLCVWSC